MADAAADDCTAVICGSCCLALAGCLSAWCNTKAFGTGGCGCCGGQRGCCGRCCDKSFDEDRFEEAQRQRAARGQVDVQPTEMKNMPALTKDAVQSEGKSAAPSE